MAPARPHGESVNRSSADVFSEKLEVLKALYPEVFSEGTLDLARLARAVGGSLENDQERYSFSWVGKRQAIRLLQTTSLATLVPNGSDSVHFHETGNLFIEGDNLEILKLLYRPCFGRVKMIYIDPPYNTGQDFVYPDNYADPLDTYLRLTGQKDSQGNLLTSNPETSGRFHSNWLSMMYPRLFIARQLLRDDGIVFVSIDDTEHANLRLLMNEVFGEENFVASICWRRRQSQANLSKDISPIHDHILCYKRTPQARLRRVAAAADASAFKNPDGDPRGAYTTMPCSNKGGARYEIITPTGHCYVDEWRFKPETYQRLVAENRIVFPDGGNGKPRYKLFRSEKEAAGAIANTWWDDASSNQEGTREFKAMFGDEVEFDNPKPVGLIRKMLQMATEPNEKALVLDFFAGSCTTALAVMEQNRADGGDRRFIMIQLPEPTQNPRYPTIAEIGKERIRRFVSEAEMAHDRAAPPDLGFRAFRLTRTHFRQWEGLAEPSAAALCEQLQLMVDPLVTGWEPEGVLWEIALKEGFSLSSRVERIPPAAGQAWHMIDLDRGQEMVVCLDGEIPAELLERLPLAEDRLFVCRDAALTDEQAANLGLRYRLKTI